MKVTTKGQYAVTIVRDILLFSGPTGTTPVKLADTAARHSLSLPYCEQIARKLRIAGIIATVRGPGGGYIPNTVTANASMRDVFRAVGEVVEAKGLTGLERAVQQYLSTTLVSARL